MPLINKQPFKPNPIPDNLGPDDEVFYHELTNEIFTCHDSFFDRFLYCNSLIWTCSRTGKSGLTYKEALDSEQINTAIKKPRVRRRRTKQSTNDEADKTSGAAADASDNNLEISGSGKSNGLGAASSSDTNNKDVSNQNPNIGEQPQPVKKKKKYPYDPKKYSMPVPEGFDPSLLTPTGKIDGRKLKSKKNKDIGEALLGPKLYEPYRKKTDTQQSPQQRLKPGPKPGKKKEEEAKRKEDEAKKKEDEIKKKALLQAELARERELEAKRKKEAATLARQAERQKKEEERKRAAAFLQNWEKKCEDLERDDLRRLPQPIPINCDIPEKLFGDAVFILESLFNLHELYDLKNIFPDGLSYDTLEEILIDREEEGPLGVVLQYLLRVIFDYQPTRDGYGFDDDLPKPLDSTNEKQDGALKNGAQVKQENSDIDSHNHENGLSEHGSDEHDDEEEEVDKDVNMNDLIGAAIKAAQEIKQSLSKPLHEMELNSTTVTEVLRLHLLQSGSFPKGRTIYNGWYSSREDPGLWLCMQEPDLIKKLEKGTIYDLEMDERIKLLHTLIYQLFSFIKTRTYIESASEVLTELRKTYRAEAAAFARWDRENCVKRMQPPKRKCEQNSNQTTTTSTSVSDKSNGVSDNNKLFELNQGSNPCSVNGDAECDINGTYNDDKEAANHNNNHSTNQLKSCLKTNGTSTVDDYPDIDDVTHLKKKSITFKSNLNGSGAIADGNTDLEHNDEEKMEIDDSEQNIEELERAYQQNLVDYEDYQRERSIRHEQLNEKLLEIRKQLRDNQSVYGVHPIGRDRAFRRYWIFQSLPGLFVEHDDEYLGKCLPNPTPLESTYKKFFNKDNPLMHQNESDLIRAKPCDVNCSTSNNTNNDKINTPKDIHSPKNDTNHDDEAQEKVDGDNNNDNNSHDLDNGTEHDDHHSTNNGNEAFLITDEMNYCAGNEEICCIHGSKRLNQPKWWFYHTSESIDALIECLNKRGFRESELHDLLSIESSLIKPWVSECPAHKLNRDIMEQSGIRRSRRLKTKGSKRRGRNYDRD